ncbi:hypothetical protein J3459_007732 [Metarhizium acridum]|nr:hypothetical protein J3459_007732 [Metarhizium acridum]
MKVYESWTMPEMKRFHPLTRNAQQPSPEAPGQRRRPNPSKAYKSSLKDIPPRKTAQHSPKPSSLNPSFFPKRDPRPIIRANAPCLGPCGIPQDMFLDFITTFDKSTQASPWLDAINLASIGLSLVPHLSMIVGIAIQVSVMAAKDVQNRARTNSFLDKAHVFTPRGLYCTIMTYSPEQDDRDDNNNSRRLAGAANVSAAIASKASGSTSLQAQFP